MKPYRALFLIALLLLVGLLAATASAAEGGTHRAALVVRYGNGQVDKRCVAFSEPAISGEELLQRSGLAVIMDYNAGLGGAVCSIRGTGCGYPTQECFCHCQGTKCEYWAYYHGAGGVWQYSQVGASSYQVADGALEGWSWGPGTFGTAGTLPPAMAFADVCPVPTATPTATRTTAPASGGGAPQVTFEAVTASIAPGACTVLKWLTWNAERVTLDGAPVTAQDRLEVCPVTTQHYVLAAFNADGQASQEVTVQVLGTAPRNVAVKTSTPLPPFQPAGGADEVASAPATVTPARPAASALRPPETPAVEHPLVLAVQAQALPISAPTQVAPSATPAGHEAAPVAISPAATPAAGRGQLDAGRPAPTPVLVARAPQAEPGGASSAVADGAQGTAPALPDRSFRLGYLPGYATFLFTSGLILGAGVWVTKRRRA